MFQLANYYALCQVPNRKKHWDKEGGELGDAIAVSPQVGTRGGVLTLAATIILLY